MGCHIFTHTHKDGRVSALENMMEGDSCNVLFGQCSTLLGGDFSFGVRDVPLVPEKHPVHIPRKQEALSTRAECGTLLFIGSPKSSTIKQPQASRAV